MSGSAVDVYLGTLGDGKYVLRFGYSQSSVTIQEDFLFHFLPKNVKIKPYEGPQPVLGDVIPCSEEMCNDIETKFREEVNVCIGHSRSKDNELVVRIMDPLTGPRNFSTSNDYSGRTELHKELGRYTNMKVRIIPHEDPSAGIVSYPDDFYAKLQQELGLTDDSS